MTKYYTLILFLSSECTPDARFLIVLLLLIRQPPHDAPGLHVKTLRPRLSPCGRARSRNKTVLAVRAAAVVCYAAQALDQDAGLLRACGRV